VSDVLGALLVGLLFTSGHVDIPELRPPVQQERIVCELALGKVGFGKAIPRVLVHIYAIGVPAIWTGLGRLRLQAHGQLAFHHDLRQLGVVVS
jgi:hypothetical protein